jgi:HlyD family secretion protein
MDVALEHTMDVVRKSRHGVGKKVAFGSLLGVGLLAALVGTLWRSSASASASATVEKNSVWMDKVGRSDLVRQVPVQGTLIPEHVQWLSAVTAARVAKILVRPGAMVKSDTVLVVLENVDLELAVLEAERQVASAESQLIQLDVRMKSDIQLQEATLASLRTDLLDAEVRSKAADRLGAEGLMSKLDHRDATYKAIGLSDRYKVEENRKHVLKTGRHRQVAAQRAEVQRLREIAKFRRRQLGSLEVHAGMAGVVQDIPLETGQWVAIGTVLAKVAEPGRLKAEVKVAEGNARDLHRGLAVRFESPHGNFRGKIERIDPAVVGGNVRLDVKLEGTLPKGARADQTVSGYVEIERLKNVLHVARPAGVQEGTTVSLFRVNAEHNHATRVTVRLGRGSAKDIEVIGGLVEGDEIVVSDTSSWETNGGIRLQ